jgi:hypothetical protein
MMGVIVSFGDPQATPIIEAKADRLFDVWLTGKKRNAKAIRDDHGTSGLGGTEWFRRFHFSGSSRRPSCSEKSA